MRTSSHIKRKSPKKTRQKEKCKVCKKEKVLLLHLAKAKKCREQYLDFEELKKEKSRQYQKTYQKAYQKSYYDVNAEGLKERKKQHYKANSAQILIRQRKHILDNRQAYLERKRKSNQRKKTSSCPEDRIRHFKQDIQGGLNYVCESCHRLFFRRSVKILTDKQTSDLIEKCGKQFLESLMSNVNMSAENPLVIFCHNCYSKIKAKRVPNINVSNDLWLDEIPEELKVSDLEQQLFSKTILFMKIKPMPKLQNVKIVERVINVPLHDVDISKTITSLPRSPDSAYLVNVKFKRKLDMNNTEKEAMIRASAPLNAVKKLQELGNPFYMDVKVDENYIDDEMDTDETATETLEDNHEVSDDEENDRSGFGTNAKTLTHADTCLVPNHLESEVVVAGEDTEAAKSIKIAPGNVTSDFKHKSKLTTQLYFAGEGKIPSNLMRQKHWDALAYPRHYPTGRWGLHHERKQKLSNQLYFQQRIMNRDERFCTDMSYLFAAQQFVERAKIESQVSLAGRKGISNVVNGVKKVFLSDVFNFLKTIRGSPKYWKNVSCHNLNISFRI